MNVRIKNVEKDSFRVFRTRDRDIILEKYDDSNIVYKIDNCWKKDDTNVFVIDAGHGKMMTFNGSRDQKLILDQMSTWFKETTNKKASELIWTELKCLAIKCPFNSTKKASTVKTGTGKKKAPTVDPSQKSLDEWISTSKSSTNPKPKPRSGIPNTSNNKRHTRAHLKEFGFINGGNTCFFNSVMQAMIHMKCFKTDIQSNSWVNALATRESISKRRDQALLYRSILYILEQQDFNRLKWRVLKQKKSSPMIINNVIRRDTSQDLKHVLEVLAARSPLFGSYRQEDAHECFMALLHLLESEFLYAVQSVHEAVQKEHQNWLLIRKLSAMLEDGENNENNEENEDMNDSVALMCLVPTFRAFHSQVQSTYECTNCENKRHIMESFNCLSLDLPELDESDESDVDSFDFTKWMDSPNTSYNNYNNNTMSPSYEPFASVVNNNDNDNDSDDMFSMDDYDGTKTKTGSSNRRSAVSSSCGQKLGDRLSSTRSNIGSGRKKPPRERNSTSGSGSATAFAATYSRRNPKKTSLPTPKTISEGYFGKYKDAGPIPKKSERKATGVKPLNFAVSPDHETVPRSRPQFNFQDGDTNMDTLSPVKREDEYLRTKPGLSGGQPPRLNHQNSHQYQQSPQSQSDDMDFDTSFGGPLPNYDGIHVDNQQYNQPEQQQQQQSQQRYQDVSSVAEYLSMGDESNRRSLSNEELSSQPYKPGVLGKSQRSNNNHHQRQQEERQDRSYKDINHQNHHQQNHQQQQSRGFQQDRRNSHQEQQQYQQNHDPRNHQRQSHFDSRQNFDHTTDTDPLMDSVENTDYGNGTGTPDRNVYEEDDYSQMDSMENNNYGNGTGTPQRNVYEEDDYSQMESYGPEDDFEQQGYGQDQRQQQQQRHHQEQSEDEQHQHLQPPLDLSDDECELSSIDDSSNYVQPRSNTTTTTNNNNNSGNSKAQKNHYVYELSGDEEYQYSDDDDDEVELMQQEANDIPSSTINSQSDNEDMFKKDKFENENKNERGGSSGQSSRRKLKEEKLFERKTQQRSSVKLRTPKISSLSTPNTPCDNGNGETEKVESKTEPVSPIDVEDVDDSDFEIKKATKKKRKKRRSKTAVKLDLTNLLSDYFKPHVVDSTCENCSHKEASKSMKFIQLPNVIVLHAKRFQARCAPDGNWHYKKITNPIHFDYNLDIEPYCSERIFKPVIEPLSKKAPVRVMCEANGPFGVELNMKGGLDVTARRLDNNYGHGGQNRRKSSNTNNNSSSNRSSVENRFKNNNLGSSRKIKRDRNESKGEDSPFNAPIGSSNVTMGSPAVPSLSPLASVSHSPINFSRKSDTDVPNYNDNPMNSDVDDVKDDENGGLRNVRIARQPRSDSDNDNDNNTNTNPWGNNNNNDNNDNNDNDLMDMDTQPLDLSQDNDNDNEEEQQKEKEKPNKQKQKQQEHQELNENKQKEQEQEEQEEVFEYSDDEYLIDSGADDEISDDDNNNNIDTQQTVEEPPKKRQMTLEDYKQRQASSLRSPKTGGYSRKQRDSKPLPTPTRGGLKGGMPNDDDGENWKCPVCTYDNPSGYLACEMCSGERPRDTKDNRNKSRTTVEEETTDYETSNSPEVDDPINVDDDDKQPQVDNVVNNHLKTEEKNENDIDLVLSDEEGLDDMETIIKRSKLESCIPHPRSIEQHLYLDNADEKDLNSMADTAWTLPDCDRQGHVSLVQKLQGARLRPPPMTVAHNFSKYRLSAIVHHLGSTAGMGHYVCDHIKYDENTGDAIKYVHYDDCRCSEGEIDELYSKNAARTGYMFFYECILPDPIRNDNEATPMLKENENDITDFLKQILNEAARNDIQRDSNRRNSSSSTRANNNRQTNNRNSNFSNNNYSTTNTRTSSYNSSSSRWTESGSGASGYKHTNTSSRPSLGSSGSKRWDSKGSAYLSKTPGSNKKKPSGISEIHTVSTTPSLDRFNSNCMPPSSPSPPSKLRHGEAGDRIANSMFSERTSDPTDDERAFDDGHDTPSRKRRRRGQRIASSENGPGSRKKSRMPSSMSTHRRLQVKAERKANDRGTGVISFGKG